MFDERLYRHMRYIRIRGKTNRAIVRPDCTSILEEEETRASWRNLFLENIRRNCF